MTKTYWISTSVSCLPNTSYVNQLKVEELGKLELWPLSMVSILHLTKEVLTKNTVLKCFCRRIKYWNFLVLCGILCHGLWKQQHWWRLSLLMVEWVENTIIVLRIYYMLLCFHSTFTFWFVFHFLIPYFEINFQGEGPDWQDFIGIICLLVINSTISFIEENNAGNAAAALMARLAPKTKVCFFVDDIHDPS